MYEPYDGGSHRSFVPAHRDLRPLVRARPRTAEDDSPTISPNGRYVAFVRVLRNSPSLFVVPTAGGAPRQIARGADHPVWARDSRRVAFSRCTSVRPRTCRGVAIAGRDGRARTDVATAAGEASAEVVWDWSSRGRLLVGTAGTLVAVDPDGGNRTLISPDTRGPGTWAPDGRQVAFVRDCDDGDRPGGDVWCSVAVANADGQSERVVARREPANGPADSSPVWLRDSRSLLVVRWGYWSANGCGRRPSHASSHAHEQHRGGAPRPDRAAESSHSGRAGLVITSSPSSTPPERSCLAGRSTQESILMTRRSGRPKTTTGAPWCQSTLGVTPLRASRARPSARSATRRRACGRAARRSRRARGPRRARS